MAQTINSTATVLVNTGGSNIGPDGVAFQFTVTGTNSLVLKKNTAPPGAAASYTNVAYLNGSLVLQSAGTAITATGIAYVSAADAALDLYATNTWTSGAVVVTAFPANVGGPEGSIPAGDITAGTFGSNSGEVGDYAVPDDFTVADLLTTSGTQTDLSQSGTTATVNVGTGTGSGDSGVAVRGAAATLRNVQFQTAGTARWILRTDNTAEAGADAGSNFSILARTDTGTAIDAPIFINRVAAGSIRIAAGRPFVLGGAQGDATTSTYKRGAVTAIADNVATTICTITVPNSAQSATVKLTALGVLGAGGAIGAGEANASNSYDITVVRTAGVNAVADISTAYGVNAAAVAGAATCTAAVTVGSVSGAVGASNTFAVQITIVKSGGASDNHTALWRAEVINQNATGVSLA